MFLHFIMAVKRKGLDPFGFKLPVADPFKSMDFTNLQRLADILRADVTDKGNKKL